MNTLIDISVKQIRDAYKEMGFKFFERDDKMYNINLWGIRSDNLETDEYNDVIGITYKYRGEYYHKVYKATTDPGLYYLKNPMAKLGACIIVHDKQYLKTFQFGIHNPGKPTAHKALRQIKAMDYWRDNNRDNKRDLTGSIYTAIYYTNLHSRAKGKGMLNTIGLTSAGCQVIADVTKYHNEFIPMIELANKLWGDVYSYTLFYEKTLKELKIIK